MDRLHHYVLSHMSHKTVQSEQRLEVFHNRKFAWLQAKHLCGCINIDILG
jgi:hypothetical protein